MKKIILAFLFLCLLCSGCSKKERQYDDLDRIYKDGKLVVGVRADAFPFGYKDEKGNLQGFDVDLAKIIAANLLGSDSKVEFVPVTASNRIMKLCAGEVDMLIAAMSVTNQRRQILDFSTPYYIAGQAIMVNSDSKATSLKDFENKKLIIVFGSTSERNLRSNVPNINVIGFKNYNDAYNALKAHKADGIIADDSILLNYAIKDKSVKILKKRYSKEPYAVVFRKDENSKRLLTQVDYILSSLRNSRKLDRMYEKWQIK